MPTPYRREEASLILEGPGPEVGSKSEEAGPHFERAYARSTCGPASSDLPPTSSLGPSMPTPCRREEATLILEGPGPEVGSKSEEAGAHFERAHACYEYAPASSDLPPTSNLGQAKILLAS